MQLTLSSITLLYKYCNLLHNVYVHDWSKFSHSFFLYVGSTKALGCLAVCLQVVCKLFGFHSGKSFTVMQKSVRDDGCIEPENL